MVRKSNGVMQTQRKTLHSMTGDEWGKAARTFVHASESVLQHGELVDLAEFLEERPEVLLVQVARYLSDEQFDGIVVLHGNSGAGRGAVTVAYSVHKPVRAGRSAVHRAVHLSVR